jgi:hypothetical protein
MPKLSIIHWGLAHCRGALNFVGQTANLHLTPLIRMQTKMDSLRLGQIAAMRTGESQLDLRF